MRRLIRGGTAFRGRAIAARAVERGHEVTCFARGSANGVGSWMGPQTMPLWIDDPADRGFATLDSRRARAAGLTTRPLAETLRDTLAFEETRDTPRHTGLTDDQERALRAVLEEGSHGTRDDVR